MGAPGGTVMAVSDGTEVVVVDVGMVVFGIGSAGGSVVIGATAVGVLAGGATGVAKEAAPRSSGTSVT